MLPNTSNNSITMSDRNAALWEENEKWVRMVLPAMVYIGIVMVIGIIGNTLVVFIYGFRFKHSTQNFLIMCLACFDLLMGAIAMPAEIVDLRFPYTFESAFVCKIMKFCTFFTTNCSILTLLTIAIDRHQRVTKPFTKQMSIRNAKCYVLINITIATIGSIPSWVLTGLIKRETQIPGLYGSDCSFSEKFHDTKYPFIYNAFLAAMFLTFSSIIGVLYFRIWKSVKTHRLYMKARPSSVGVSSVFGSTLLKDRETNKISCTHDFSKEDSNSENYVENGILILKFTKNESDTPFTNSSKSSDLKPVSKSMFSEQSSSKTPDSKPSFLSKNDRIEHTKNVKRSNMFKDTEVNNSSSVYIESSMINNNNIKPSEYLNQEIQGSNPTTKVAFAVTLIFILSFVPYLTFMFILAFNKNLYDNMHGTTLWMYNILVRFYLFNSALNPIVYGLLNEKFRLELRKIWTHCISNIH